MRELGLSPGLQRHFGDTGLVVSQLGTSIVNMVIGLLLMSYALAFSTTSESISPVTLLRISLLAFVVGILSFSIALLSLRPKLARQSAPPQPDWQYYQQPYQEFQQPYQQPYQPQVLTRQYVTGLRRTILEQARAWTGLMCPVCGRDVSAVDSFCDSCGTSFRLSPETTRTESVIE